MRSVANREDPNAALQAALGGSLCFIRRRLPPDAAEAFAAARDRLISEYANEAIVELGAARTGFTDEDRAWVRTFSAAWLPDIEKAPFGQTGQDQPGEGRAERARESA